MGITETDIKLLESQRMTDTTDGGGRMTFNEVPDGVAGNIFPKVSRVDSVYGRVNLRKLYPAVMTATLDTYAGAHCIITDPPDNDKIGCLLFSTGSSFDTRSAAQDRIESYVVAGPLSRMRMYGKHLAGQKAIAVYQPVGEPLPDVGDVIVLSVEASGYDPAQQYVRITDVTHEVRTFTDSLGDYQRRVITLKIGAALSQTFTGAEPTRYSTDASPTKVRMTQVADASKYYGIQPLAEAALTGAMDLRLASVYASLVPSTSRETAVSMAEIGGATQTLASSATKVARNRASYVVVGTLTQYMGRQIKPGSLWLRVRYFSAASIYRDYTDNSAGQLVDSVGAVVGTVSYQAGTYRFYVHPYTNEDYEIWEEYLPAVEQQQSSHTHSIPITLATRGTVYAETLLPVPAPGTLILDFRALGRWYRLRDDGSGQLSGNDPAEGVGSIDYQTGALVATLGALPDVDSALLLAWGSPAHYAIRAGATEDADTALEFVYQVQSAPIVPGSVTISYPVGGVSRDATDVSADGNVSGTGVSGTINYATGEVRLRFTTLPDRASNISTSYTWRDGADLIATGTAAVITDNQFTVPGVAPFRNAGGMVFLAAGLNGSVTAAAYITSGGQVRVAAGSDGGLKWADQAVGTFAAQTGVVTLAGTGITFSSTEWVLTASTSINGIVPGTWETTTYQSPIVGVSDIAVERDEATFDPMQATNTIAADTGLTLDLTTTVADSIVPGSVLFSLAGKTYIDRDGLLYADVSASTGSGTEAGSINYTTGVATLTLWADNTSLSLSIRACLTQRGEWEAIYAKFRTAGSPLRPASLYVQVTAADGALLTGTADSSGTVTGAHMRGSVQQDMGIVSVEIGEMVTAAGNETEWWYDADNIADGMIWRPRRVLPATLRYNSVVITNLPLDAAVLGLDPVRLPSDGRVPIYRPADVVVIHHTATDTLPNPLVASTVYNLSRAHIERAWVEDSAGATITTNQYILDLDAGTLTTSAALDLAGYIQPVIVRHRIEDMALLADVQINGQVSLTAPLTHDYPLGSYLSGALLFGDLTARVTNLFDQATWSNVWSDERIGSDATATYNDLDYPVEVLNNGAITERWRINFTSTTAFQLIGENLGVIAIGDTGTDLSPVNTLTGQPYFTLRAAGWGLGWAAGNQLRFNTIGANAPTWIARTILAGATLEGDAFDLEVRGDTD